MIGMHSDPASIGTLTTTLHSCSSTHEDPAIPEDELQVGDVPRCEQTEEGGSLYVSLVHRVFRGALRFPLACLDGFFLPL